MGTMGTIGMAEAVNDGLTNLETAVSWQLQSNHFPPVPTSMVAPCCEAIMAVAGDDGDKTIDLPDPITYKDRTAAPAWAIVEAHHLYPFVEQVTGEWIDDEGGEVPTPGTRVRNQAEPVLCGTVGTPVDGLEGFVHVAWDNGLQAEEWHADITTVGGDAT